MPLPRSFSVLRRRPALTLLALALLLGAGACGAEPRAEVGTGQVRSLDPGTASVSRPAALPVVAGPLRTTRGVAVLDDGQRPRLCAGGVEESYPPQCSGGYDMLGWDWSDVPHDSAYGTRWVERVDLQGTFDGIWFTVTDVLGVGEGAEAPGFDPAGGAATGGTNAEQYLTMADIGTLPGALGTHASGPGQVQVDVLLDDGSIQRWVDAEYGAGVVLVNSLLVPVETS